MKRTTVLAAILLLVLGVLVGIRLLLDRTGETDTPGFLDFLKDPALQEQYAQSLARRDEEVEKLMKEPPEELVSMLLDAKRQDLARRAIKAAGPSVCPALLNALSRPEFRRKSEQKQQAESMLLTTLSEPLVAVLDCLCVYAPEEAAPVVAPLIDDPDGQIRKQAILLLGALGVDSAVPPQLCVLSSQDNDDRSFALMGISDAIRANRVSEGFRTEVFDAVWQLASRGDIATCYLAPECLLGLDRERAARLLASPENLRRSHEGVPSMLRALREADVPVDEDLLLGLVRTAGNDHGNERKCRIVGEALLLLARHDSEAARSAILKGTESLSKTVQGCATEALAVSRGIRDPYRVMFDRLDAVGWKELTDAQRHVLAARFLIDEVNNGGFAQYFFNSSGEYWREALAGLKAIGATSDLELLQEAIAALGSSSDDLQRNDELARVVGEDDALFPRLEDRFYKDEQDREVLLLRYIMAHPNDFLEQQPP